MRSLLLVFALILAGLGCSSSQDTLIIPDADTERESSTAMHSLMGFWEGTIDPVAQKIEMTPIRQTEVHLNALHFLEPPALLNLTLDYVEFSGDTVTADIGLLHPFLGLTEFSGFDVCGIFISNGTKSGYSDSAIVMAGDGETRLTNPDGYSRWWNPTEFPVNAGSMFSYQDGLLGVPDSVANFSCTLNGYKYYCDDLDTPDAPLTNVTQANRGLFSAGQKNSRRFIIQIGGDGLTFNYAIDASWMMPQGAPPYQAPQDFPPGANRPEAWRITTTEIANTLYNDGIENGGDLSLSIDVYDWFNADSNTVRVESPGTFAMVESSSPSGGGAGYSTYQIDIVGATPPEGSIELFISVISGQADFGGFISGTNTTSYFMSSADVSDEAPVAGLKNLPLRTDATATDIAVTPEGDIVILYEDAQVWKHMAADGFTQDNATHLFTAQTVEWPGSGAVDCDYRIDVASTGNIFASAEAGSPWPAQCFDSTGNTIGSSPGPGAGDSAPDVYIYPAGGFYGNNNMFLCPGNGGAQNNMYRHVVTNYWAQIYQTGGENASTGYDKVKFTQVVGAEGVTGSGQFWLLEDAPDYYAARWQHTGSSYGWFNFDSAWFGTGTQTSDDTGWYDAQDLTWDASNNFYVLDKLASGQGRIKLFQSGTPGIALTANATGNVSSISETPLRIEGSPYTSPTYGNLIFVLHGDAIPSKLSIFPPSDFGF